MDNQYFKKLAIALYLLYLICAICTAGLYGFGFVIVTSLIAYIVYIICKIVWSLFKNPKYGKFIYIILLVLVLVGIKSIMIDYKKHNNLPNEQHINELIKQMDDSEFDKKMSYLRDHPDMTDTYEGNDFIVLNGTSISINENDKKVLKNIENSGYNTSQSILILYAMKGGSLSDKNKYELNYLLEHYDSKNNKYIP